MQRLLQLSLLLVSFGSIAQNTYNDTLFYKSGLERPCDVTKYTDFEVYFTYLNSKDEPKSFSISTKKLKYFVVYDLSNTLLYNSKIAGDNKTFEDRDSIYVSRHILSVNPFSLAVLGLNVQYIYRFGDNLKFGAKATTRLLSPLLFGSGLGQFGFGFTYLASNNERFSLTVSCVPSFAFGNGDTFFSIPITMGLIRYFTPKICLTGNIGAGPGFNGDGLNSFPIPSAHIGIGFQLGQKQMINY